MRDQKSGLTTPLQHDRSKTLEAKVKQININENSGAALHPRHSDAAKTGNLFKNLDPKKLVVILVGCFVLSVAVAAQDLPSGPLAPQTQLLAPIGARLTALFTPAYQSKSGASQPAGGTSEVAFTAVHPEPAAATPGSARRITLEEAQQMGAGASNPMLRLGELQVEAARQHKLGVRALYFPNLGSQFEDLHFNKQTAKVFGIQGPLGNMREVQKNIFAKDSNSIDLSAVQPLTPLLAIRQLVKIAQADENIARSKAGMPVAEVAGKIEKTYYELLVAQRELVSARADVRKIQGKWMTASSSGVTSISPEQEKDLISAQKAVLVPESQVKELTASLDEMLGLSEGTELELLPPDPLVENTSLKEVTDKAMAANPEVVQAEQTAIKAHAASKITKMAYGPNVAIVGGYMSQNLVDYFFPRGVSYIGAVATFTIFDFGKREADIKEGKANAQAADLGVQLTKAKVAAAVKSSYYELERSRQLTLLARRMISATRVVEASYQPDNAEVESARAKVEADMFRAELEYRQAFARLKTLMGDK
jgi:outer membrane protein TolC